jgi:hypothetical protein
MVKIGISSLVFYSPSACAAMMLSITSETDCPKIVPNENSQPNGWL